MTFESTFTGNNVNVGRHSDAYSTKSVIFSMSNMPALTVIRNDTFSGLDQLVTVRISGNPRLKDIEQRSFGLMKPGHMAVVNLR